MDRQQLTDRPRRTGVESSAAFFAPTKAVASLSAHNSSEHLSSTGPAEAFIRSGDASPDRDDRTRARASTRRHDRAPCAPVSSRVGSLPELCLSLSLSLSLSRLSSPLASNGGRSPRRARARRAQRRQLDITARSWARLPGSMPQRTQARAPSPGRTCNHMQSDAISHPLLSSRSA